MIARTPRLARCTGCGEERSIVFGWKTSRALCMRCNNDRKRKAHGQKKKAIPPAVKKMQSRIMLFEEFAKELWATRPHVCEECGAELKEFKGMYVSHIVGRDLSRRQYYNPENVNILCEDHHREWEYGNRRAMKIWATNEKIIERLKSFGY